MTIAVVPKLLSAKTHLVFCGRSWNNMETGSRLCFGMFSCCTMKLWNKLRSSFHELEGILRPADGQHSLETSSGGLQKRFLLTLQSMKHWTIPMETEWHLSLLPALLFFTTKNSLAIYQFSFRSKYTKNTLKSKPLYICQIFSGKIKPLQNQIHQRKWWIHTRLKNTLILIL